MAISLVTRSSVQPDVVERARTGDAIALEQVIQQLARELLPLATALAGADGNPQELLGDALSRVYERIDQIRSAPALVSWARKILVRLYLDERRRGRRDQAVRLETINLPTAPTDVGTIDLRRAVARLPRDQRSLIVLHYWLGLTLAETGEVLGIREGTVKSRLHDTLRVLRGELYEN